MSKAPDIAVVADFNLISADAEDEVWIGAQKREPSPFFVAFHTLQKKDVGLRGQLAQGGDWRLYVGEDFPVNGNQVSFSGKLFEFLQIRIVHMPPNEKRP